MATLVLNKTDKGREEIETRKYRLGGPLRRLLVMIDGRHSREDLLTLYGGLGASDEAITELLDHEFVETIPCGPAAPGSSALNALIADGDCNAGAPVQETAGATLARQSIPSEVLSAGETPRQALYNFYTQTIKSTLGLRGFTLQLKVERANSNDDFRALRQQYHDAILKARGKEMARSLIGRLDQLLQVGVAELDTTTLPQ